MTKPHGSGQQSPPAASKVKVGLMHEILGRFSTCASCYRRTDFVHALTLSGDVSTFASVCVRACTGKYVAAAALS